jgi:c-di-GMP-binding flagellar brake protein YcgR
MGTSFKAAHPSGKMELPVLDISENGARVATQAEFEQTPDLKPGDHFGPASLLFSPKEEGEIKIREALVKRSEKHPQTGRFHIGIMFTKIDLDEKSKLRELIYKIQRELLQKKRLME